MSRPKCSNHPQVNIHWIHCIGNFFTIQLFWTTCTCPEKHIWSEILHCIEIFSIIQDFWVTYVCPENFHCIEYTFHIQDFWATCACPEKQSVPWIHLLKAYFYHSGFLNNLLLRWKTKLPWNFSLFWNFEIFFIIQEFWATCACPENKVCPEFFHWIEIFFNIQEFWAICACPENRICPEIF